MTTDKGCMGSLSLAARHYFPFHRTSVGGKGLALNYFYLIRSLTNEIVLPEIHLATVVTREWPIDMTS